MELGTLYYDDGEYVKGIETLSEAVERYPDDPRIVEVRFRLADSYRRHAAAIDEQLLSPGLAPSDRNRLEARRTQDLTDARDLFHAIVESPGGSTGLPEQLLRLAYLYRGDCSYDLGHYQAAVDFYDQVAGRYPEHHSSMTALIQIVNCYANLGDVNRARTAHRRAIVRLKRLPAEAFDAPDSLLDRGAWERWLQNMPVGENGPAGVAGASS